MKKRFALLGSISALAVCTAYAGTLFTTPIIFVQPQKLDFGRVPPHRSATNSFVLENVGGGTLAGKATVDPPFKIIVGETYKLNRSEIQLVTVVYTPNDAGTNVAMVKFDGADTPVTVKVMGKLDTRPRRYWPKH